MNWDETIENIKGNYSKKHLDNYPFWIKLDIIGATSLICFESFLVACYKSCLNIKTPINFYENELNIFKSWFCYIFAKKLNDY